MEPRDVLTLPIYKATLDITNQVIKYTENFKKHLQDTLGDMINLLKEWFPEATEEELDSKIIDLAVNWLNDEDYGESKIWCYFK